jgi:hypothetical protein
MSSGEFGEDGVNVDEGDCGEPALFVMWCLMFGFGLKVNLRDY